MRRISLVMMAAILVVAETNAQLQTRGFYFKVAGGYFFSVSPGQFPDVGPYAPRDAHDMVNPGTGATTRVREKVLTGSYGEGIRGGISGGYVINRNISVELTVNYFSSKKNLMTRNITTIQGTETQVGSIESDGYVQAVDLAPGLVISPGYEKFNPYIRFGFVVPVWGRLYIETDASRTSAVAGQPTYVVANTTIQRKEEVHPNPTIGFQGALGCTYTINPKLGLFLEAEYRNVPVKSKSKEVTAYNETTSIVNINTGEQAGGSFGRSLSDLSIAERNTDYVTTLDQNSNTPIGTNGSVTNYKNNNAPSNDLKSYINIGGLGANLGLRIRL